LRKSHTECKFTSTRNWRQLNELCSYAG
jgi:hypothetical protein